MKNAIALFAAGAVLAGCSNIATVNGVPIHGTERLSTQDELSFFEENPAVCIVGGAVAFGALGFLVSHLNGDDVVCPPGTAPNGTGGCS